MIIMKKIILIGLVVLISGCASVPKKDYTAFYTVAPRSILIVPVVNRSVEVDAPNYFLSSITIPVTEQGYYVFPVNTVKRVLEDNGLSDADLVHKALAPKVAALFGADAVLYISINRWDARYMLLTTTVTVDLTYELKDGKTGDVLWADSRHLQYTPQGASGGNVLANLIVDVVQAALVKAAPNYMPLARQANAEAFTFPGPGIPPGPYSNNNIKR